MSYPAKIVSALAAFFIAYMGFATLHAFERAHAHKPLASATLLIEMGPMAHGSGVHIGNGYVLTAAHVADDEEHQVSGATDTLGNAHHVEVLWSNHKYDIALMRVDGADGLAARRLSCRFLRNGEPLSFEGNPLDAKNLTTYGQVANSSIQPNSNWAEINMVSAQIAPGMSGGAAIDAHGALVGINVGVYIGYALGIIVPGRTICKLMDK